MVTGKKMIKQMRTIKKNKKNSSHNSKFRRKNSWKMMDGLQLKKKDDLIQKTIINAKISATNKELMRKSTIINNYLILSNLSYLAIYNKKFKRFETYNLKNKT